MKDAKTAAPEGVAEDLRHSLDAHQEKDFRLAQKKSKSVPACNSTNRPDCKKAKTAAPKNVALPEDMTPITPADIRYPLQSSGYA